MKILQIYELGPLDAGKVCNGIDVAILELSRNLSKLGHEVTILTGAGGNGDFPNNIDGIKIITTDFAGIMKRTWDPINLKFFRQAAFPLIALREELDGYDIYHGHIYTSGLLAAYLARKNGGRAVNTIHGSYYPVWGTISPRPVSSFYRASERLLAPLLARLCSLQIHTGRYFAQQVVEWGASGDTIKVIHNGANHEVFNKGVVPADFEKNGPLIFTARRLVRKNGLEFLLEAVALVLKEKKCSLLIAGDGPEKERLISLTESLGISENVTFLGMLPHERVPSYLALCDFAVVPSLIEASSLFVLEAMAMGKPVIATRTGGIPEIMKNGSGILVEPSDAEALADKILMLLDHSEREKFAKNGRKEAANFTWEKAAKKTEREYLRILG
jgi:glycosyltransferase involved in cell wall biosynthesis